MAQQAASNTVSTPRISPLMVILGGIVLLLVSAAVIFYLARTQETSAQLPTEATQTPVAQATDALAALQSSNATLVAQLSATPAPASTLDAAGQAQATSQAAGIASSTPTAVTVVDVAKGAQATSAPITGEKPVVGMIAEPPSMPEKPVAWVPQNGQPDCQWDVPFVTEGTTPDNAKGVQFTNCTSFNLMAGASYEATWYYGTFPYFNSDLGRSVTHSTMNAILWNWTFADGKPSHDGAGWWGPLQGASITVTYFYADGSNSSCTGINFEIVEGVTMKVTFRNVGTTAAVFSQGPWGIASERGINPPACRPDPTRFNK